MNINYSGLKASRRSARFIYTINAPSSSVVAELWHSGIVNIRRRNFNLSLSLVLALGAFFHAKAADPEIVGSMQYSNQVRQALVLLKAQDTNAYSIVTNYVGRIQEGAHSGMWADKTPPTFEASDRTVLYSVTWCAATIAHDSFHSKLYHDYLKEHGNPVPDKIWEGTNAEQQCMIHQLQVMEHIGAPKREIDYAKTQMDGHYVKEGDNSMESFQKRAW